MRRHIRENNRIRTDAGKVTNHHMSEDDGACSYVDATSQHRRIVGLIHAPQAEGAILPNDAFVADHCGPVNDDARLVLDDHAPADCRRIRQLDPVVIPDAAEQPAVDDAERCTEELGPDTHSPNAETIDRKRPKARPGPISAMSRKIFPDESQKGQAC